MTAALSAQDYLQSITTDYANLITVLSATATGQASLTVFRRQPGDAFLRHVVSRLFNCLHIAVEVAIDWLKTVDYIQQRKPQCLVLHSSQVSLAEVISDLPLTIQGKPIWLVTSVSDSTDLTTLAKISPLPLYSLTLADNQPHDLSIFNYQFYDQLSRAVPDLVKLNRTTSLLPNVKTTVTVPSDWRENYSQLTTNPNLTVKVAQNIPQNDLTETLARAGLIHDLVAKLAALTSARDRLVEFKFAIEYTVVDDYDTELTTEISHELDWSDDPDSAKIMIDIDGNF